MIQGYARVVSGSFHPFAVASLSNFAQQYTQTVKGKVIDAGTQVTLPGANIVITDTDPLMGGTSDLNGNYWIENVPVIDDR